jgi:hypothetical protein
MTGYDLFRYECKDVKILNTGLHLEETMEGLPALSGLLSIKNGNEIIDTYSIRITPQPDYPNRFPFVFETMGKIPINIDWHVFSDGHFCLCTIPEELLKCKKGFSLCDFIETEVKPYLFNQTFRREYGFFNHERKHGFEGELEYYKEILGLKDVIDLARFFISILNRKKPKRTDLCFCGSGNKFRNCHRDRYLTFEELSQFELHVLLSNIGNSIQYKKAIDKAEKIKKANEYLLHLA